MSVDRVRHSETRPAPGVAYIERARIQRAGSPAAQIDELRNELRTERSAGKGTLVAVLELERRLDTERSTGRALLATVRELGASLDEQRHLLRRQRMENERLWADLHGLEVALYDAERPIWRKLLRP